MKFTRTLATLLAIAMLLSALPAQVFAVEATVATEEAQAVTTIVFDDEEDAADPEDTTDPSDQEAPTDPEEEATEPEEPAVDPEEEPSTDPEEEDPAVDPEEEEPSTDPEEEPEAEPEGPFCVTLDLGDSTLVVEVMVGECIPAEEIPTENEAGTAIIRWYNEALTQEVDPASLVITEDTTLVAWYAPVLTSSHTAYMNGYGDSTFGPNNQITRAQVAQILYNLLEDNSVTGSFPCAYADVSEGDWYYTAVTTLASLGVLDCDGGDFNPNEAITRAEFVGIVTRLTTAVECEENPFPDVTEDSPYYAAIMTAYALGWIYGHDDGTFGIDGNLTRAEACTIFNRILGRSADSTVLASSSKLRTFTDVSTSSWYYSQVMEATIDHEADTSGDSEVWTDYTKTSTVTLVVGSTTTTQEVYPGESPVNIPTKNSSGTAISYWVLTGTNTAGDPYVDEITADVSYTACYVISLSTSHTPYISGYGDGTFGPDAAMTRAEACSMLYSLLKSTTKGSYPTTFSDVKSGSWYYTAVTTLASLNVISADGGAYNPDEAITRGEFAQMISRLTSISHTAVSFTDVDSSNPYYYAICTVVAKGWFVGMGDGTFGVDKSMTRAEAVTVFNKITGRYGDSSAENAMDSRYTFTDVSTSHWGYVAIMEAATTHVYTISGTTETWSSYSHATAISANWSSSASVVAAASIILTYSSTYSGNYTQSYNVDYSDSAKEAYVNNKGYSSSTGYLVWVSLACQKVYVFTGSQYNWTLVKTFICGSGKSSSPTPVGVTYITYRQTGWYTSSYTVAPVVRFYPGTGYAFHSRLYYPGTSTLKDASIGYPCSHGCIRMLTEDVTYIYNNIPNNTTVVIY